MTAVIFCVVAALVFGASGLFASRARRRRRYLAALARADELAQPAPGRLTQAERLARDDRLAVALHEALALAPDAERRAVELRMFRVRTAWTRRHVARCVRRARRQLDRARDTSRPAAIRHAAALRALAWIEQARRWNHRPPVLRTLADEARDLLGAPPPE